MMRQALGTGCVAGAIRSLPESGELVKLRHTIDPRACDTYEQHRKIPASSPFAAIAPENLCRLSIDPSTLRPLEQDFGFRPANPLLPYVFDNEKNYLHNMGKARIFSATHPQMRAGIPLILKLHDQCLPRNGGELKEFDTMGSSFPLQAGGNMTEAGRLELMELEKEIQAFVPRYRIVLDPADPKGMRVERPAASPVSMHALVEKWIAEYDPDKVDASE